MKRFSSRQAAAIAGRRAATAATVTLHHSRAPTLIACCAAAWHAHACFSSQTAKAVGGAKANSSGNGSATTPAGSAPQPGSSTATQMPTPATMADLIGTRGSSRSRTATKRKKSTTAAPQPPPQPQHKGGRRHRCSTFTGTDAEEHVKPMRGRKQSDAPRKRRTALHKATLLLQSQHQHADAAGEQSPSAGIDATAAACLNAGAAIGEAKEKNAAALPTQKPANGGGRQRRSSPAIPTTPSVKLGAEPRSSVSAASNDEAASLTTAQLLSRLHLTTFVEKVTAQVREWSDALKEWSRPTSDPTLREWERQLLMSLRKDSFADCTVVQYAMQQRYEDQFGHSRHDVAFLTLYARVLMNNAIFCLINFVTYRATQLLTEALAVAQRAYTLKQRQQQQQQDKAEAQRLSQERATGTDTSADRSTAASTSSTASPRSPALGDPEGYLLFLRVLLANAYASDQQLWKAAEQYQLVLSALERSPLWTPDQLTPGLVSPLALNHTFVRQDAKLFYADTARVDHAVSQGTAQLLLLQSQGVATNPTRLMHTQLAMARLHRHASRYAESQSFYEKYLDGAAQHMDGEDVAQVMLELGRLLLYKVRDEAAAVIYLESAANMLLEDAEELLKAVSTHSADGTTAVAAVASPEVRIAAGNASQRAAGGLIDTAMAFHALGQTGKAVGLLEGCLQLLDAADLRLVSGWVREQYADMLATVSLVDRALEEYGRAMELLRDDGAGAVEQLGAGGRLVSLSAAEVEGHMAFCLQTYVGDHKRAMTHYRNVMQGTASPALSTSSSSSAKASSHVASAQTKLSKRARRQRAATAAAAAASANQPDGTVSSSSSSLLTKAASASGGRMRVGGSGGLPTIDLSLKPDILHWVLSNYVACCERVGAFAEAVGVQNRLIEIEGALGGNVVDSYLKLITLQKHCSEEKTLALCFYVFYLPDTMMSPKTRLEVASHFAASCHALGNNRMGSVLLQAVQEVCGDHDANSLVHYAMCLRDLAPADRLQLDGMMDIEASISSIGRIFRRAASIVVTEAVVDGVEEEEAAAASGGNNGSTTAAADAATKPTAWTHARMTRARDALIVLSRGAFFFHQNRFMKDAAELYATALEQVDRLAASMPSLTEDMQREMGILLVNYATLKAAEDPQLAATLYERAAAVCPTYMEVAEVVADFFVQSGNYAKGSVYMKRVLRANPATAADMHLRLARLGTGAVWDTMPYAQRMEVMEHLLRGLGVSQERVAAGFAMMAQRQLGSDEAAVKVSLKDISQLLMDGIATTMSEDAVCLATYVVQARFQEPQLLNRMYRRALLRFPQHATILVNYATLCMYSGYHVLARKYIAKAYAASSGDLNCTMCYAHYLCRSFDDQQAGCGEALYRAFVESHPTSAPAHAAYANFMAGLMPTPFKTEAHFKQALALAPKSEDVVLQYGQFMWACTDSKTVYTNDDVRRRVFDRAEQLFNEAVSLNPQSFTACHQLGTFYANRHNRFEEAMTMLYRAHKLQPGNVEVLRHLLNTLHEECVRVQREAVRHHGTVAGQGSDRNATPSSPRLRSLTDATQDMFESILSKEPHDRATLERYARFAVETLRNPTLAASLYSRIQELNRKR